MTKIWESLSSTQPDAKPAQSPNEDYLNVKKELMQIEYLGLERINQQKQSQLQLHQQKESSHPSEFLLKNAPSSLFNPHTRSAEAAEEDPYINQEEDEFNIKPLGYFKLTDEMKAEFQASKASQVSRGLPSS